MSHCTLVTILSLEFNEAIEFHEETQELSMPLAQAFGITWQASPNAYTGVSQMKAIRKVRKEGRLTGSCSSKRCDSCRKLLEQHQNQQAQWHTQQQPEH